MRRLLGAMIVPAIIAAGLLAGGCRPAAETAPQSPVATTPETSGQPGASGTSGSPQAGSGQSPGGARPDDLTATGLPPAVAQAVRDNIQGDDRITLSHWIKAENGWYLVELVMAPTMEHLYFWVSSDGAQATFFTGFAEDATFAGESDGLYRFICDRVGDSLPVFPYYEVAQAGAMPQEVPFFKVPNADEYVMSLSGLAYELKTVNQDSASLELLFALTGPEPGGVMAGGSRPPAGKVVESDGSVKLQLRYVTLGTGVEEAIKSFSSSAGALKGVTCGNGTLELEFSVPWAYSVSLAHESTDTQDGGQGAPLTGYRISFISKPESPESSPSLSGVAATIKGIRAGEATVEASKLLGDLQKYLLRAFPLQKAPPGAGGAVDISLLTAGQWRTENKAYVAGSGGKPSYVKWQSRWYELDPAFDTLLPR